MSCRPVTDRHHSSSSLLLAGTGATVLGCKLCDPTQAFTFGFLSFSQEHNADYRYVSQRQCTRKILGKPSYRLPVIGSLGRFLLAGYEGPDTLTSHRYHHSTLSMPFKSFSLRQRRRRSHPPTSHDQPLARKYHIGTTIISFSDFFWPDDATIIHDPALHIDTHDDIAIGAIQTSLAVLMAGSSLASKLPFIAPIAGLLLQALTMRDARVPYFPPDNVLMSASPGSEAV